MDERDGASDADRGRQRHGRTGRDDVVAAAAPEQTDLAPDASVVLQVWNGSGFTVVHGTVEDVEPSADFPDDPNERVVILAEDDANAYRAGDVVALG